jgi:hypothetical protein
MTGAKAFEPSSADGGGLAAAGSRGVTGLNLGATAKIQTLQFTGMNRPAVITTGCSCGPTSDSPIGRDESHGVLGVDVENCCPTDLVSLERVNNANTLITDHKFGANEDQMCGSAEESAPDGNCCGIGKTAALPSLKDHGSSQQGDNCCVSETASRSEGLLITHKPIIAGDK